ncbi:hypothetical protein [Puerhibacterium puerhi]|uniref:hypothetical protein n=1 Tax=Puerhibacterium puerhi TaxID=2692623 RepID=UPI0013591799|nr:hypothetical protein [Puerhibacterium puerhi]
MSIDTQGGAGRGATRSPDAPEARRPTPTALVLRPVGYLLMTVLWMAIAVFPFVLGYGLVPSAYVMSHLFAAWEPVEAQHLYWWEELLGMDPEHRTTSIVGMVVMMGPLLGLGFLGMIAFAIYPMILLYGLAFFRSLNPRYSGDRLTYTTYAAPGSTFGPPTTSVALSAIPTYETRFTRLVMRFYWYRWQPSGRMILGMMPAGMGLLLGVLAVDLLTPAPGRLCRGRRGAGRSVRGHRPPGLAEAVRPHAGGGGGGPGAAPDQGRGHGQPEEMTPQQRLERVKRLRAEREARITMESE